MNEARLKAPLLYEIFYFFFVCLFFFFVFFFVCFFVCLFFNPRCILNPTRIKKYINADVLNFEAPPSKGTYDTYGSSFCVSRKSTDVARLENIGVYVYTWVISAGK